MPISGRGRSSRLNDSPRSGGGDAGELADLLESLRLVSGGCSARSPSGRHSHRSGLIPPSLEPPHRIPSRFPVPQGTLAQVPGLSHPSLSRGQRRYLHSTAQIYSLDGTKRALSDSYYGLLMGELLKGSGSRDSHSRYTGWIYGNHKRLFETDPAIWRSRKLKTRRDETATNSSRESSENATPNKRGGKMKPKKQDEAEAEELRGQQSRGGSNRGATTPSASASRSSARGRNSAAAAAAAPVQTAAGGGGGGGRRKTRGGPGGGDRAATAGRDQQPRVRRAAGRVANNSPDADVCDYDDDDGDDDGDYDVDNKDGKKPKDLSRIMY